MTVERRDPMDERARLTSDWLRAHVRAHGSTLYIVERLSVVG